MVHSLICKFQFRLLPCDLYYKFPDTLRASPAVLVYMCIVIYDYVHVLWYIQMFVYSGHNLPDRSCVADTAMHIELA